ncbi:MAG: PAS domain-containing sensor histidine kinase [Oscillospiraceae bacterium]|nr:PAS domain-containing sensor histidine kinase [Oscillospiraceae bacterium]
MRRNKTLPRALWDALLTAAVLSAAVALCAALGRFTEDDAYVGFLFVLAVVFVSRWTEGYFWGIFASFFGVVCVNYVFTYPYWEINFTMTGYPLTFVTLLAVALMVSAMTTQIKRQERLRLETEREAMRADLLRAMSHDIRTPLTSIVGNTAAVLEDQGALSAEQKRALLRDVNEDAQWLIRMVENILSITRIHGGADALATEYQAAEEILGAAAVKFGKRFPDARVSVEAPEEVLLVPMDATLIEQVILNLLENAVIHGGAAHIRLRVERDGESARFTVSDDGRGVAPEKLATLFDAAAAPRGGSDGKKNMGIGLSVCRSVVKAHGGAMTAENRADGGARVCFTLPLKEEK